MHVISVPNSVEVPDPECWIFQSSIRLGQVDPVRRFEEDPDSGFNRHHKDCRFLTYTSCYKLCSKNIQIRIRSISSAKDLDLNNLDLIAKMEDPVIKLTRSGTCLYRNKCLTYFFLNIATDNGRCPSRKHRRHHKKKKSSRRHRQYIVSFFYQNAWFLIFLYWKKLLLQKPYLRTHISVTDVILAVIYSVPDPVDLRVDPGPSPWRSDQSWTDPGPWLRKSIGSGYT